MWHVLAVAEFVDLHTADVRPKRNANLITIGPADDRVDFIIENTEADFVAPLQFLWPSDSRTSVVHINDAALLLPRGRGQ